MNTVWLQNRSYKTLVQVKDDFIENCPKDHMCCLLDMSLYNTYTDKKKRAKEFFYLSEKEFLDCHGGLNAFGLWTHFFENLNHKNKYDGWSIGVKGSEDYYYFWGEDERKTHTSKGNIFLHKPMMCGYKEMKTEYPEFFRRSKVL